MATYRPDAADGVARRRARRGRAAGAVDDRGRRWWPLWPHLGDDDPTPQVLDRLTAPRASPPRRRSRSSCATPTAASARVVVRGGVTVRVGDDDDLGRGRLDVGRARRRRGRGRDRRRRSTRRRARPQLPIVEGVVSPSPSASDGVEPVARSASPRRRRRTRVGPAVPRRARRRRLRPLRSGRRAGRSAPAAEQTMVPAEDTIAAPSVTPARGRSPRRRAPRRRRRPRRISTATTTGSPSRASTCGGCAPSAPHAVAPRRRTRRRRRGRGIRAAVVAACACPTAPLEPIGHEVVLGRAPSVSQVVRRPASRASSRSAPATPTSRATTCGSRVEGDTVVVTDLHSRNGTHVVAARQAAA